MTASDVRKAAQKWIDPTKMAIVLVGDEKTIGEGVKMMVGDYERRGTDGVLLPAAAASETSGGR